MSSNPWNMKLTDKMNVLLQESIFNNTSGDILLTKEELEESNDEIVNQIMGSIISSMRFMRDEVYPNRVVICDVDNNFNALIVSDLAKSIGFAPTPFNTFLIEVAAMLRNRLELESITASWGTLELGPDIAIIANLTPRKSEANNA